MKVLKKIFYYLTICILAILLSDACPDFSDQYVEDIKEPPVNCSVINQVIHFFVIEILNFQHNSTSHQCTKDCHHNIELDVFIPSNLLIFKSLAALPYLTLIHYHLRLNQIFIDIIPLPPSIRRKVFNLVFIS